jgi:hypothetical protein
MNYMFFLVVVKVCIMESAMSELTLWQQIHSEWAAAKLALDEVRGTVDGRITEYLKGNAKLPDKKMMLDIALLTTHERTTRDEVDAFISARKARVR